MNTLSKGKIGESLAVSYLQSQGYRLYARNVRVGRDEIDAILFDPSEKSIVFLEVKSRSKDDTDYVPALDLTHAKRKKLFRSAESWVAQREYEGSFRIDVMYIVNNRVADHLQSLTST